MFILLVLNDLCVLMWDCKVVPLFRTSSAWFLSSSWPPSCLRLQSRPSGASLFHPVLPPVLSPLTAVLSPSCGVLSKLRKMEPGAAAPRYGQLLDCLCSWGQAADVVELVTDWLAEDLPKQGVSVAERHPGLRPPGLEAERSRVVAFIRQQQKGGARRKVRIQETVEAKPELALAYLEYLLNHTASRETVLAVREGALKQLHAVLGSWRVADSCLSSHCVFASRPPFNVRLCSRCSTLT